MAFVELRDSNVTITAYVSRIEKYLFVRLSDPSSKKILKVVRFWQRELEKSDFRKVPFYKGPAADVHILKAFLFRLERLYSHTLTATVFTEPWVKVDFWEFVAYGLDCQDREIMTFHRNLMMLFLYPAVLRGSIAGTSSWGTVKGVKLAECRWDISKIGKVLWRLADFTDGTKSRVEYYRKLRDRPQLLKKMEILSLPLYTAFIKA